MLDRGLTEALDQAIALVAQGTSVDDCVQTFPSYAEPLRPLLQVCAALHQLAQLPCPLSNTPGIPPAWIMGLAWPECDPREQT